MSLRTRACASLLGTRCATKDVSPAVREGPSSSPDARVKSVFSLALSTRSAYADRRRDIDALRDRHAREPSVRFATSSLLVSRTSSCPRMTFASSRRCCLRTTAATRPRGNVVTALFPVRSRGAGRPGRPRRRQLDRQLCHPLMMKAVVGGGATAWCLTPDGATPSTRGSWLHSAALPPSSVLRGP
jgi:hypothetical protein